MASRLILRRQLRQIIPDANAVRGYWVQLGTVKFGSVLYWDGRWYEKMGHTIAMLLDERGMQAKDSGGWPIYQDIGQLEVPVFITSLDVWNNPHHGTRPQAQNGPAPPPAT